MCNQTNIPSVTLQTAVLMQVQEFAKNSTQFSVHDITTEIRKKTSSGQIEIPEVEIVGSSIRFDIPHVKIKAIFDELWQTGVFDPYLTLSRQFNGTYFVYTPTVTVSATIPTVQVVSSGNAGANPVPTTSPTIPVPSSVVQDDVDVQGRIDIYLENCATRNFRPTLKQVQSAIKRTSSSGWTCSRIYDYIQNVRGITVVSDPDFVSASQVATV